MSDADDPEVPPVSLPAAFGEVFARLAGEARVGFDAARFGAALTARLDGLDASPPVVPRAEAPELDVARFSSVLSARLDGLDASPPVVPRAEAPELDVARFASSLSARLDGLDASPPVVPRAEAPELDVARFASSLSARLDGLALPGLPPLDALAAPVPTELEVARFRRDLERRLDALDAGSALPNLAPALVAAEAAPPPTLAAAVDRRIEREAEHSFRRLVEGELAEVEPAMKTGVFLGGVERKIGRLKATRRVWAPLAVAAAVLFALFVPRAPEPRPSGEVVVDDVSFEGTVTVLPQAGVTLIWLADPHESE